MRKKGESEIAAMSSTLLLIDDDVMIHRMLVHAFRNDSYTPVSKHSGEEALAWMQQNFQNVEAIILDWELPGVNGLQVLKQLKSEEQYKDIPVVMLTSHNAKSEIQEGIESGAYYYVTKPFNKAFLLSIVGRAVHDFRDLRALKHQLSSSMNPFSNMLTGSFRVRTLEEAQRLSVMIANASETPDRSLLICELLNNAVEHGNLGIGYEEKTLLIEENRLMDEIRERLENPDYKNKYALVQIERNNGALKINVKDEGEGFDYKRFLQFDESRIFDNHGRGIARASAMLQINYLGKGNEVEVMIPLS